LAKFGDKAYADKYEMVMRRESKYSNQIWQVDHSVLKIKFLNNNISKNENKSEDKDSLWLTIVMDDFSRAIMGFHLFVGAPSAIHTALALRKAIWYKQDKNWLMCGIPEVLYTDHGADFTSTHIDYVCADLKIQLIHSAVGKPRGRGKIERFFLSLEQKLIEQLKFHDNAYQLEELEELIKNFIINDYHNTIHGTTKETPVTLWNKNHIIPQMPESIDRLNLLLLTTRKSRIVQRDGIHFSNLRYFHPNLVAYVGEPITVRFDPSDLSEIWVYEQNQLICKAVCEQYQDQNISYEELKKIRTNRKKELKHEINTSLTNANLIIRSDKKEKEKIKKEKVTKPTKLKFKLYHNE
jgi:putative transposase